MSLAIQDASLAHKLQLTPFVDSVSHLHHI